MNPLLLFFIPPLIGAFIGYSTNIVAIRMLFRPLKEIRVFGVRLPFTPGILPRQRGRLAQSIGGMVERELLTPEILRGRLYREDVQKKIREALARLTENIFDKTPSDLLTGSVDLLSKKVEAAVERLYPVFSSSAMEFLNRAEIRVTLESKGRIILRNIILKLNTFQRFFLSAAQYDVTLQEKMPEIIDDLRANAESLLKDEKVKKILVNAAAGSFCRLVTSQNEKIISLLNISAENKEVLDNFLFEKLTREADNQIENALSAINVKSLVSERIDSLDMLRVERIILDVMSDQLRWVEIFGGVLGFLIGLFQSFFSFFARMA